MITGGPGVGKTTLVNSIRDSLAIVAAPYFHARLASTTAKVQFLGPVEMTDEQLREWNERAEAALRQEERRRG